MMNRALDRNRAPIFEALQAHASRKTASFHVPGHKSGAGVDPASASFFTSILSIDLTEITGLDDLHHPEGIIGEAQRLAADCFGAEESYFLVGGSTVGNLTMITTLCEPGDLLLVQRNVHKSVINGLMLAGASAVFLPTSYDAVSGTAIGVSIEDVAKGLGLYPEAKGLLVTNPNYYGMGVDLRRIAELLHRNGKPLLVDEAHGAHYGFHPSLPPSALACGADVVVQSTHKMLTAMTMGAMLHVQGQLVNRNLLKNRLAMLQSSSPSYPIMASLDLARRNMHMNGFEIIEHGLLAVQIVIAQLDRQDCFGYMGQDADAEGHCWKDPFKISIYDKTGTLTGPQLQEALEEQGCFVEMSDLKYVLLLLTPASTREDAFRVIEALGHISAFHGLERIKESATPLAPARMPSEISVPIAFQLSYSMDLDAWGTIELTIQEAVGKRSAEMVTPYPPGIPLLYPGERVTQAAADYLQMLVGMGIRVHATALGISGKLIVYNE
ncbi:Arginine decarboxylase [compost metagenome]